MEVTEFLTKKLNPEQKRGVETLNGPLLILAGAGSGKTRVLTHRVANLIGTGLALPEQILAVTFTNKAAREMEARIFQLLGDMQIPVIRDLWVSTFHSICARILREHIHLLDYKKSFVIYDDSDQLSVIKKIMTALNINDKMFPPRNFASRIDHAKQLALGPDDVKAGSKSVMDAKSLEVYRYYEEEMKRANALDFGDLLFKTYELFRMYPDILGFYQEKFKYVLVDEYQDTNHLQYLLVKMLSEKHRNLCVVGDEDQSIYSWRGADISNILSFEKDFPETKVVKLEENYRSSGHIVKAATGLIKNNNERKDKTLFTSNPDGELILVREEKNEYDEARFLARKIEGLMNAGEGSYSDYAVFYRTNAQSRVLEEQLRMHGIPYRIVGGVKFYDRMEIKDVLSYMKLALNPNDDVAFKRVINTPTRGIGKTTVERLEELAIQDRKSLMEIAAKAIDAREFNAGTTSKLRRFLDLMGKITEQAQVLSLTQFYPVLLDLTEYVVKLKAEETPEAQARIENLDEFDNALHQFSEERGEEATLLSFLEEMALVSDADALKQEQNAVTLMTLHISKGLEYPYVFITGMEEGLFPSGRALEEMTGASAEEERRLAYVGITRAREKLFLTYTRTRRVWGSEQMNPPSRFLAEIPKEHAKFESSIELPRFVSRHNSERSPFENTRPMPARNKKSWNEFSQDFPDYDSHDFDQSPTAEYHEGMKVRHPTFGAGSIFKVEGAGDQLKVSVVFGDKTVKKFVAKYARLERV
ncbi:MAG: ATP-dependent helicase [Pseudobdellovibrionaceae bacterium]